MQSSDPLIRIRITVSFFCRWRGWFLHQFYPTGPGPQDMVRNATIFSRALRNWSRPLHGIREHEQVPRTGKLMASNNESTRPFPHRLLQTASLAFTRHPFPLNFPFLLAAGVFCKLLRNTDNWDFLPTTGLIMLILQGFAVETAGATQWRATTRGATHQARFMSIPIATVTRARSSRGAAISSALGGTGSKIGKRRRLLCQSFLSVCLLPALARGFALNARASLPSNALLRNKLSLSGLPGAQRAPAPRVVSRSLRVSNSGFSFAGRVRRLLASPMPRRDSTGQQVSSSNTAVAALVARGADGIAGADRSQAPSGDKSTTANRGGRFPLADFWRKRLGAARRKATEGAEHAGRATLAVRSRIANRAAGVALLSAVAFVALQRPAVAAIVGSTVAQRGRALMAMMPAPSMGGSASSAASEVSLELVAPKLALWFTLFVTSAAFHSAEIAITTLYPWKVKEFAEEEGENSPFQVFREALGPKHTKRLGSCRFTC